jgi:hypothetical protein
MAVTATAAPDGKAAAPDGKAEASAVKAEALDEAKPKGRKKTKA